MSNTETGNLQAMRYGNGVTNLYGYDALNRLTNLVWNFGGTTRASFAYQLKRSGTRTNLNETVGTSSRSYAWSYDSLYRLTNEVVSDLGNLGYAYDPVGNRTNRSGSLGSLGTQLIAYDTNDWVTTDTYDTNGNTTVSGGITNHYDALNRLISIGNGATNFLYDGDGNRVSKTKTFGANNETTYFLIDDRNPSGFAQVLEEYQQTNDSAPGILGRVYNYGLMLISQQQFDPNTLLPSTLSYYGFDGHGSVRFLTDANGSLTDTYTYDAFGNLITSASSGSTPNVYLYSGQQFDPDLGLYYNRARYLNTDTGRFWTSDTYTGNNEDPLSLHKYLYAECDPVDNDDPSGRDIGDALTAIQGIGSLMSFFIGNLSKILIAGAEVALKRPSSAKFCVSSRAKPPTISRVKTTHPLRRNTVLCSRRLAAHCGGERTQSESTTCDSGPVSAGLVQA